LGLLILNCFIKILIISKIRFILVDINAAERYVKIRDTKILKEEGIKQQQIIEALRMF